MWLTLAVVGELEMEVEGQPKALGLEEAEESSWLHWGEGWMVLALALALRSLQKGRSKAA